MELIENLLQLLTTFVGALLSGIAYRKSRRQAYFLLLCFYGCFALGALYWTLYLLLFDTTPRVFYVSEFGWVASLISVSYTHLHCEQVEKDTEVKILRRSPISKRSPLPDPRQTKK